MNRTMIQRDRAAARFYLAVVAILALLVLTSQVLGATLLRGTIWGADAYGFFPPAILLSSTVAALALLGWIVLHSPGGREVGRPKAIAAPSGADRWLALAQLLVVGLAFGLFWQLRIRHTLFGDSGPISRSLPLGQSTHLRQPLSLFLHHVVYNLTAGFFQRGDRDPADVAFDTVALGSAVAGAMLVPVALGLARELASSGAAASGVEGGGSDSPAAPPLVAAVVLTQGYVQLLFGYVENYTYFTLAMGVYLWTALRFLRGRSPLILCGLALVIAVGLNLSGLVLLVSFLVITGWGLARPRVRRAVTRDVVGTGLGFVALAVALGTLGEADQVAAGLHQMWGLAFRGAGGGGSAAYLLSGEHLRDFFDIHFLIGPFAAFLLVPAALRRLVRGDPRDARLWFLLACAVPPLAASWSFGDPLQGFPRDWDLFAPFALLYTVAAVYCLLSEPLVRPRAGRLLAAILVVSLFHTAPWIVLNTSADRSLERYKTLPISRGRGQFVVGYWYLSHGQKEQAREWFWRSVEAYAGNNAAHYFLGTFARDEGRYDEAARHFMVCTQVRPDKTDYRFALADALVLLGHPGYAAKQLALVVQVEPENAQFWACYGVVLCGIGYDEEARGALERARSLAPQDTLYARLLARVGQPDAYARAVGEDWRTLATP